MNVLKTRLKSCIQAILDLQPVVRGVYRASFAEDFRQLQSYLVRIDKMELAEEDVVRLEGITSDFLREVSVCRPIVPAGRLQ